MAWSSLGKLESNKTSLGVLNSSCAIGAWNGGGWYATGYPESTAESYYRVRNSRLNASIIIPETTTWNTNLGAGEWHLVANESFLPKPRDVSATYRVYGYAHHSTFGGSGSDFLMEYVHNLMSPYIVFKFLVANQGFISTLSESNKNTYLKQFFGTYGGISINLEYDI